MISIDPHQPSGPEWQAFVEEVIDARDDPLWAPLAHLTENLSPESITSHAGDFPRYWPFVLGMTGEFPSQRPVTRSFVVFFDLHRNKRSSKQSKRHRAYYDVMVMRYVRSCICRYVILLNLLEFNWRAWQHDKGEYHFMACSKFSAKPHQGTWSETYFPQDLFPAYLFFRRQFHAIVIFRFKSFSDLDSGSLPRFFGEFICAKLKIVVS